MWLWKTAGTRIAGTQRGRNTCVWDRAIRRRSLWTPEPSTSTAKVLHSLLLVSNLCTTPPQTWIHFLFALTLILMQCKFLGFFFFLALCASWSRSYWFQTNCCSNFCLRFLYTDESQSAKELANTSVCFIDKFTGCATMLTVVISLNCCINIREAAWSWICLPCSVSVHVSDGSWQVPHCGDRKCVCVMREGEVLGTVLAQGLAVWGISRPLKVPLLCTLSLLFEP